MSYCVNPFKKPDSEISFPCGKCLDCRKRRASSWGFRLAEQLKVSDTAYFVTLTYDESTVPRSPLKGRTTLNKRDVQLYIKRLRKKNNDKLKYYLAGEYGGGATMRPHYHMIIFNVQLSTLIPLQDARRALLVPQQYLNGKWEFNENTWENGYITIGTVTAASVMYTLKYISKKRQVPQYKYDDRTPEFSLISKGIGKDYLSDHVRKWHKEDSNERMYVHFQHYKVAMPRYYKERLYSQDERESIAEYIVNKQKQQRVDERKGTKLKDRIEYIRQINVIKQDKDRKLNKKTQFRPNVH